MKRKLLTYGIAGLPGCPAGFTAAGAFDDRSELLAALSSLAPAALLMDIDADEAPGLIMQCLEQHPRLAIVGATSGGDIRRVVAAQRAGCAQIATYPLQTADLAEALSQALPADGERAGARLFSVIGVTGGAGATTVSCVLPFELARISGGPVLLVDGDLELGGVARAFDLSPSYTLGDLARLDPLDADTFQRSVTAIEGASVSVLPRPTSIEDAQQVVPERLQQMLELGRQCFGNVVVDLPRRLDENTGVVIENSDAILLVTQLTVPSVDNAARLIDALEGGGIERERVKVVVNRYRKNVATLTPAMVQERLRIAPAALLPSDYAAVHEAFDRGEPLPEKHAIRVAIADLAGSLLGDGEAEAVGAGSGRSNGWFSKLGIGRYAGP